MKDRFLKLLSLRFNERNRNLLKAFTDVKQRLNSRGLLNSSMTVGEMHSVLEEELKASVQTIINTLQDTLKRIDTSNEKSEVENICKESFWTRVKEIEGLYTQNIQQVINGLANEVMLQPYMSLENMSELQLEEMNIKISEVYRQFLEENSSDISEPPAIIKQLIWIKKNWNTYWLYLLIGAVILFSMPIYGFVNKNFNKDTENIKTKVQTSTPAINPTTEETTATREAPDSSVAISEKSTRKNKTVTNKDITNNSLSDPLFPKLIGPNVEFPASILEKTTPGYKPGDKFYIALHENGWNPQEGDKKYEMERTGDKLIAKNVINIRFHPVLIPQVWQIIEQAYERYLPLKGKMANNIDHTNFNGPCYCFGPDCISYKDGGK